MTIVVDASVAIKFSVEELGSAAALELIRSEPALVAPDLILTEAANAYWAMVRTSRLLMVHAEANLEDLPRYFNRLYPTGTLIKAALTIAFQLRHPVYDCVYVALAEKLGCRLMTADRKFHAKACERYPVDLLPFETDGA
ncbi:type II toxin-antitoxin system VapC family toxin [Sphingomonas sp. RP10(2022)]|uniref:Ribonuclease VapC n=1 Tax=Sphingomonas liriopis TaxID=2949094 RepID=A0A9X2HTN7_9SPHN|nr:type II toxin-antitoxin system VapC family toxin [Sphingomonas liriopis]MCP3736352.1 type II toxin-antitoxin system VapC family toxin [Sphingomonas liriopis]